MNEPLPLEIRLLSMRTLMGSMEGAFAGDFEGGELHNRGLQ